MAIPPIDPKSKQGQALQQAVEHELRTSIDKEVPYEVLSQYIVVMLSHGNSRDTVAENLFAFLGRGSARRFVHWLFDHVEKNQSLYAAENLLSEANKSEQSKEHEATYESSQLRLRSFVHIEAAEASRELSPGRQVHPAAPSRRGLWAKPWFNHDDRGASPEHSPQRARGLDGAARVADWDQQRRHERPHRVRRRSRSRSPRPGRSPEGRDRSGDAHWFATAEAGGAGVFSRLQPAPEGTSGQGVFSRISRVEAAAADGAGGPEGAGAAQQPRAAPRRVVRLEDGPSDANGAPLAAQESGPDDRPGSLRMDTVSKSAPVAVPDGADGEETVEQMEARMRKMQLEITRMTAQQREIVADLKLFSPAVAQAEADSRSVVVQNVHFLATEAIVAAHFTVTGPAKRVTIARDKATGNPKGYAFVEFFTAEAAVNAINLTGSAMLGRQIKVIPKETRVPGSTKPKDRPTPPIGPPAGRGRRGGRFGWAPRGRGRWGRFGGGRVSAGNKVYIRQDGPATAAAQEGGTDARMDVDFMDD
mmetsp:Transcript_32604/g.77343  ORF Transcript_32604/g.77343 Transcript_32604/m.77343 type:complete len:532 (+) Transcript_32604:197-1792(+)